MLLHVNLEEKKATVVRKGFTVNSDSRLLQD
jgi:hypothetical protein